MLLNEYTSAACLLLIPAGYSWILWVLWILCSTRLCLYFFTAHGSQLLRPLTAVLNLTLLDLQLEQECLVPVDGDPENIKDTHTHKQKHPRTYFSVHLGILHLPCLVGCSKEFPCVASEFKSYIIFKILQNFN